MRHKIDSLAPTAVAGEATSSPCVLRLATADWTCLLAVFGLLLNDHLLKYSALPPAITGKISDFAGVYFFPLLLADLTVVLSGGHTNKSSRLVVATCSLVTAAIMLMLKLSGGARQVYVAAYRSVGVHVGVAADASDLWSLLMLGLVWQRFHQWQWRSHAKS